MVANDLLQQKSDKNTFNYSCRSIIDQISEIIVEMFEKEGFSWEILLR